MNILKAMRVGLVKGGYFLKKHAPTILTVFGVSGSIGSVVLAVKATPKAMKLIDERKKDDKKEKLTVIETVDTCWKVYTPAAISLVTAVGCIIGANCLNLKAQATLLGLYSAQEGLLQDYKKKVIESVGPEKAKEIQREITQERIDGLGRTIELVPLRPNEFPFIDDLTGQIFSSTKEKMETVELQVRDLIRSDQSCSVNDYLQLAGMHLIGEGYNEGYNEETGFYINIETGEYNHMPVFIVYHEVPPVKNFNWVSK